MSMTAKVGSYFSCFVPYRMQRTTTLFCVFLVKRTNFLSCPLEELITSTHTNTSPHPYCVINGIIYRLLMLGRSESMRQFLFLPHHPVTVDEYDSFLIHDLAKLNPHKADIVFDRLGAEVWKKSSGRAEKMEFEDKSVYEY